MVRIGVALMALGALVACAPHGPSGDDVEPEGLDVEKLEVQTSDDVAVAEAIVGEVGGPVLATLRTRDRVVVIYGGGASGPRFTVASAGGTVLGKRLAQEELERRFPELHDYYESAFASDGGGWIDASATPIDAGL